jgi:Flp pilus assembly pilin Flp
MQSTFKKLRASRWIRDTRGGLAEYVILTVVVAVGAIGASKTLKTSINTNFNNTATTDLANGTLKN